MKVFILGLILALTIESQCRSTNLKRVESNLKISSLSDKDAKRKAMEHPAFANAGTRAGVEIWRIEDFEPVAVPSKDQGKFYKGDSYIILKTSSDKRNNLSWDIHYWLGSSTSQDEAGAAAILTVGLDDKFNGAAIQHREVEGHESSQFIGYFNPAIRYLDGGHASGFSHVTTNAGAEKRLFQIKGKRNVRVRQIDPLISSMNKGDCFILDVDQNIYVYVGEKAKNVEKLKAISVANQIRDQDHNGRGKVEIIDQYSSEADTEKFFTALGSGNRALVPEESAGGDDQTFERSEEQTIILSEISDSTGSLKITPLSKPFKQEQLKPQECYILDTVSGSIYVWVGKQSTQREKTEAMSKAEQYLKSKNYPSWVHVSRIPQGTEPAAFKQYFSTWRDVGMSHSRLVRSASDEELYASDDEISTKRARVIAKSGSARGFMPDNGEGQYTVYRIENMELNKIYDSDDQGTEQGTKFGEFFQGDTYVIKYEYSIMGNTGWIIYYWIGQDSTLDEQAAAAMFAVQLDRELDGKAAIVRVPQGQEPRHFLKIFKGSLVTLYGGKASGFKNLNEADTYDTDGIRLFRVHGTAIGQDMRVDQVPEIFSSLKADDVFILETPQTVFLWFGEDSSEEEQEFSRQVKTADDIPREEIQQGEETDEFRSFLDDSEMSTVTWQKTLGKRTHGDANLYEAILHGSSVTFDHLSSADQKHLQPDSAYVLDTGDEIYIWIGAEADSDLKKSGNFIAEQYFAKKGQDTNVSVSIIVKQAMEPEDFTNWFEHWDPALLQKLRTYEDMKEEMLNENTV